MTASTGDMCMDTATTLGMRQLTLYVGQHYSQLTSLLLCKNCSMSAVLMDVIFTQYSGYG